MLFKKYIKELLSTHNARVKRLVCVYIYITYIRKKKSLIIKFNQNIIIIFHDLTQNSSTLQKNKAKFELKQRKSANFN